MEDACKFITGFYTVTNMGRDIKNHMNPQLLEALEDLAHMYAGRARPDATGAASATADAPMAAPPVENLQAFFEGLPSTQLKAVTLSIDGNFWEFTDENGNRTPPPKLRYFGKPTSLPRQHPGKIYIMWEAGLDAYGKQHLDKDGKMKWAPRALETIERIQKYMPRIVNDDSSEAAQQVPQVPQVLSRPPPDAPAESSEADAHDDPIVQGEPLPVAAPFVLAAPDFTNVEHLKVLVERMVRPAAEYFKTSMEGKRGTQLQRMKAVRFFNPMHVHANGPVTVADIDGLSLLRLSREADIQKAIQVHARTIVYNSPCTEVEKYQVSFFCASQLPRMLRTGNEGRDQRVQHPGRQGFSCRRRHAARIQPHLARERGSDSQIRFRAPSCAGKLSQLDSSGAGVLLRKQFLHPRPREILFGLHREGNAAAIQL